MCASSRHGVVLLNASDVLDNVQQTQQPQDGSNSKTRTLPLSNGITYSFDETKPLGKGAQGYVFKATSPDGSLIALKIVENKSSRDEREYANLEKIKHPCVVELVGRKAFTDPSRGNLLAIGMALVVGESYEEYLKENGKVDWKIAADEFRQLITGMQAVHQQVP
jgi:serine/threonine protein kinase